MKVTGIISYADTKTDDNSEHTHTQARMAIQIRRQYAEAFDTTTATERRKATDHDDNTSV